ncbi:hypothetical protein QN277_011773 [Acacia crassicarpa]|uniref:Uncharacterized protein n=1 Tax=Acacia crassicarpa TaxID=499986 RepID=A0AAE1MZQ7_9FABA|nr:hypothetical protein QN277_011773 [Acacia crassicarpa]
MATSGGGNVRNGTHNYRSSLKSDRPLSANSNLKNHVKSEPLSSTGQRRNSTSTIGSASAASKDDDGAKIPFWNALMEALAEDGSFVDGAAASCRH